MEGLRETEALLILQPTYQKADPEGGLLAIESVALAHAPALTP